MNRLVVWQDDNSQPLSENNVSMMPFPLWESFLYFFRPRSSSAQVNAPVKSHKDGAVLSLHKRRLQTWRHIPSTNRIVRVVHRGQKAETKKYTSEWFWIIFLFFKFCLKNTFYSKEDFTKVSPTIISISFLFVITFYFFKKSFRSTDFRKKKRFSLLVK